MYLDYTCYQIGNQSNIHKYGICHNSLSNKWPITLSFESRGVMDIPFIEPMNGVTWCHGYTFY